MERDLVMPSWVREAAATCGGAMESSPSRSCSSSSGCQSGWTLYLDHSNGNGMPYLPCDDPAAARRCMVLQEDDDDDDDVEDSMASDASSGPRALGQGEDTRRDFEQRPQGYIVGQHSYSCSVHCCSPSSGSGGFGSSTWSSSRSSQGHVVGGRRGVVVHGREALTTRQYREIVVDEEDELDDTASSSSAVFFNPVAMVHVNVIISPAAESTSAARTNYAIYS